MGYPVLSRPKTEEYVRGRREGTLPDCPPEHELRGPDDDCFDIVEEALQDVIDGWRGLDPFKAKSDSARDKVEGELSVVLYKRLRDLPGSILSDRDFWRYCAARLYEIVQWRYGENGSLANFGAATNAISHECLPHKMFERAHIAFLGGEAVDDSDPFALARFGASDVWRSHLLRTLNGNAPLVAHEILADVAAGKLKTDLVREVVKNLRRVRANVLFEVLGQQQARELLDLETAQAVVSSNSDGGAG
ncbi:hypothetical protein H7K24_18750 [Mycobacterium fragae]|uniref:Uncharacterized protein n=1 Tax=Mycobacterium fragae TaxID=1260918 RepID=A0A1X1URW4_9MYCO|nr:hypothetical protein [Mycobacterium fragae]MCV7402179.1 hypothetical protein [Mycobacterium fragae]ORV59580.1 hypothetical protein AWC06_15710 [Mycobacterium fragae]